MADPFTTVLQTFVQLFRTSAPILAIGVQPANVIDISAQEYVMLDPVKPDAQASMTPEIIICPARGKMQPYGRDSRTTRWNREFLFCITTNTLRVGGEARGAGVVTLFSVEWAMTRTLSGLNPNLGLNNSAVVAVQGYAPEIVSDKGLLDQFLPLGRGRSRWTAIISVWVDMYWLTSAIVPQASYP